MDKHRPALSHCRLAFIPACKPNGRDSRELSVLLELKVLLEPEVYESLRKGQQVNALCLVQNSIIKKGERISWTHISEKNWFRGNRSVHFW